MNEKAYLNSDDLVIDLVDMVFFLLKRWRSLVALLLVGLILGGGFGFWKGTQSAQQTFQPVANAKVEQAYQYHKLYNELLDYQQKSPLMAIDPESVYVGTLVYAVDAEQNREAIVVRYENLMDEALADKVLAASGMDVEKQYVHEIAFSGAYTRRQIKEYDTTSVTTQRTIVESGVADSCIVYEVKAESAQSCAAMLDVFRTAADALDKELRKAYPDYTLENIADSVQLDDPREYLAWKETQTLRLDTDRTKLQNVEKELNDQEKQSLNLLLGKEVTVQAESAVKSLVKMGVIGAVLGVFAWGGWFVVAYLVNGRIKTAAELQEAYGLPNLGCMAVTQSKAKGLDALVHNWEEAYLGAPAESAYLTALVGNMTQKPVALCTEENQEAVQAAARQLAQGGLVVLPFPGGDTEALNQVKEIAQVVLLIQPGVTSRKQIQRELFLCGMQDVKVIGTISVR